METFTRCNTLQELIAACSDFNTNAGQSDRYVFAITTDITITQSNHDSSDYPLINNGTGAEVVITGKFNQIEITNTSDFHGVLWVTASDASNIKLHGINLINSGGRLRCPYKTGMLLNNIHANAWVGTSDSSSDLVFYHHRGSVEVTCCTSTFPVGMSYYQDENVYGGRQIGYIMGSNFQNVNMYHCIANVNMTAENIDNSDTTQQGGRESAGILGSVCNLCTVKYCVFNGSIDVAYSGGIIGDSCQSDIIEECYSLCNIHGLQSAGIAGNNTKNCIFNNCYHVGELVQSDRDQASVCATATSNHIINSYYHRANSGDIRIANSFTGSDVVNRTSDVAINKIHFESGSRTVWEKVNSDYPILRRFTIPPWNSTTYTTGTDVPQFLFSSDGALTFSYLRDFYNLNLGPDEPIKASYFQNITKGLTNNVRFDMLQHNPKVSIDQMLVPTPNSDFGEIAFTGFNQGARYLDTTSMTLEGDGTGTIALELTYTDGSTSDIYSINVNGQFTFKQKLFKLSSTDDDNIKGVRFYSNVSDIFNSVTGECILSNAFKAAGLFPIDTIAILSFNDGPTVTETDLNTSVYPTDVATSYFRSATTDLVTIMATDTEFVSWSDMQEDGGPIILTNTNPADPATEYVGLKLTGLSGEFEIACFGGAGGGADPDTNGGGDGGYITARVEFEADDEIFISIGTAGRQGSGGYSDNIGDQGYNVAGGLPGGGHGGGSPGATYGGSGGGATWIALNGTDLADRIMVAGAGGGAADRSSGGHGGQFITIGTEVSGISATPSGTYPNGRYVAGGNPRDSAVGILATGGTFEGGNADGSSSTAGGEGYGGSAGTGTNSGPGGGSGWFGGGGGRGHDEYAAGGGSSWAGGLRILEYIATDYGNLVPRGGTRLTPGFYVGQTSNRAGQPGYIIIKRVA